MASYAVFLLQINVYRVMAGDVPWQLQFLREKRNFRKIVALINFLSVVLNRWLMTKAQFYSVMVY